MLKDAGNAKSDYDFRYDGFRTATFSEKRPVMEGYLISSRETALPFRYDFGLNSSS